MGTDFELLFWHRLAVYMFAGFLPVYLMFWVFNRLFQTAEFVKTMALHFPKSLPISAFFFYLVQIAGLFYKKTYLRDIFGEIGGDIYYILIAGISLSCLILLFVRLGRLFNRLAIVLGLLLILVIPLERISATGHANWYSLSELYPLFWKSILWFLFLGLLIAFAELIRMRAKRKTVR